MASRPRVLPFSGDDGAYNHYLEQFFLTVKARYPSAFKETCCLIPAPSFLATNEEQENSSLQVCHYDPTPPPLTHDAPRVTQRATRLLERIPRTEKDWQIARHQLGFENEQQILSSLSKIRGCAWRFKQHELKDHSISALGEQATAFTQELSALSGFVTLISFLFFVTCCFEESIGADRSKVDAAMKNFISAQKDSKLGEETRFLRKVRAGTLKVVALIDRLYEKLGHRAFELLFYLKLYPTVLCHLTNSDVDYIISSVDAWDPTQEVQARTPLYVVFLLQLWRPNKSSEDEGNLHISLKRKRNETSPATSYQNIELDSPSSRPRPLDPSSTISSDRSPSYFPNSIISVDTNSTTLSDGHPLSPSQGPMLCYDTGIEEEARNITSLSLSKNALETGTLPSQDRDEPDDWIRGTEVELIGPNATEEFYAA
ncbi:hypothetical protein FPOAC1_003931 [Fusarium poae]|uniref:hypothetical protein n=1 Tax=Fusarium poae TaxID=36050 RepID=UPI001CE8F86B|nr:hypothetical protein FPOAC1_003931 [Fusarium poae]KAG8677903.1 hypothetical protein FPOAC1_003931 [Fusarium poae]